MTTWEIGQQIEKIMEEGAKAADAELMRDWSGLPLPSSIEVQKEIWARLINWKGVQIR